MKRLDKYLLISLLAISLPKYANGCWVPSNLPAAYYMYRVYEGTMEASTKGEETTSQNCAENCREWQKMTSRNIPLDEIHYRLCHFRTVAQKYPDTAKGRLVRGECDKWVDYDIFNK